MGTWLAWGTWSDRAGRGQAKRKRGVDPKESELADGEACSGEKADTAPSAIGNYEARE